MEILTLLKANIHHKKGSFISIVVLMVIVSMALASVLGVRKNCLDSIRDIYEETDTADVAGMIADVRLSDELLQSVVEHPLVDRVERVESVGIVGEECNGVTGTNTWFVQKMDYGLKLYKDNLNEYEEEVLPLSDGEMYVAQGLLTSFECEVGDTMTLTTISGDYSFTIKGVVVEPMCGASVMGWKQVFISDSDFEKMHAEAAEVETEEQHALVSFLGIYKAEGCELSDAQFRRQLNKDTGIIDYVFGTLTKEDSMHYTSLFSEIVLSCMMVFIVILLVIVLIVMGHSISTGIEVDYVNLGVLKSQGFGSGRIRAVFVLQYLLAEMVGVCVGMAPSFWLTRVLSDVFWPITGILAYHHFAVGASLLIFLAVFVVSGVFIFAVTAKVGKISPIRAIVGGRNEIYFDSRLKAPIYKRGLSASLAFRQFISAKRRYVASILVAAILVFFMLTINVLGNLFTSKAALGAMGEIIADVAVKFQDHPDEQLLKGIEQTVEQYSPIKKCYYVSSLYLSLDGESVHCTVYGNPEVIGTVKGRAPLYDNEIVITEILAEDMGLSVGDEVEVSHRDKKDTYVVSGLFASSNDAGRCFAMSLEGAEKLDVGYIGYGDYELGDADKAQQIAEAIEEKYGESVEAKAVDWTMADSFYYIAVNAMKAVIYCLSTVFAFVVVTMVCARAFVQERGDIGIYKALGFTSGMLRVQFAVRFLIVSLLGSALGIAMSVLFTGRLLEMLLRSMGITNFVTDFTLFTVLVPVAMICICFFVFAFLVSGKIRRVEIRELVVE